MHDWSCERGYLGSPTFLILLVEGEKWTDYSLLRDRIAPTEKGEKSWVENSFSPKWYVKRFLIISIFLLSRSDSIQFDAWQYIDLLSVLYTNDQCIIFHLTIRFSFFLLAVTFPPVCDTNFDGCCTIEPFEWLRKMGMTGEVGQQPALPFKVAVSEPVFDAKNPKPSGRIYKHIKVLLFSFGYQEIGRRCTAWWFYDLFVESIPSFAGAM